MPKNVREILHYFTVRSERGISRLKPEETPPCFESKLQFQLWRVANTHQKAKTPCVDCTITYQQEMLALGRCQHPDVIPGEKQHQKKRVNP